MELRVQITPPPNPLAIVRGSRPIVIRFHVWHYGRVGAQAVMFVRQQGWLH